MLCCRSSITRRARFSVQEKRARFACRLLTWWRNIATCPRWSHSRHLYAHVIVTDSVPFDLIVKETAHMLRNGWSHTGDKGYYDENENIFIIGRYKECIKYSIYHVSLSFSNRTRSIECSTALLTETFQLRCRWYHPTSKSMLLHIRQWKTSASSDCRTKWKASCQWHSSCRGKASRLRPKNWLNIPMVWTGHFTKVVGLLQYTLF